MLGETVSSWIYGTAVVFVLAALAFVLRRHVRRVGAGRNEDALRIVSTLHVGPQHRLMVVEWARDGSDVRLLVSVTPQRIELLSESGSGSDPIDRRAGPAATPALPSGSRLPGTGALP